ncbi:MAG: NADH-quinone oxidoreductase subunit NuoE [Alphaproteobacteria bacterium]|nr:NADH-quinone oxidoreductase subunit NuoE [Alphaproteobacteria bacterium]
MTKDDVAEVIKTHGTERTNLLPVLQDVAATHRFLTEEDLVRVARAFKISAAEVYSVASFYSLLETQPRGRFVIRVCRTISCSMSGKGNILTKLKEILGIDLGETTPDKRFSLLETNCMGWCAEGPSMLINDTVYSHLTPEKVVEIIKEYRER